MKYTEFNEKTKIDHISPPWEKYMKPQDFISYLPSYVGGKYRDTFEKKVYKNNTIGDITYYVYNPIEHGASKDKKYPLLMFFHGRSNSLDGEICITHSGAELYASPEYQKSIGGGAFIVVPLANEKRSCDGEIIGEWSEEYLSPIKNIFDLVCNENKDYINKKVVLGGSAGGYFTWKFTETYPESIDICIPISSRYVPNVERLSIIEENNIQILVAHGRHDELTPFDKCIAPFENYLKNMKNCYCYFPEWVKNGDGGIASLNFGFEMGQHCLINQIQANLMYIDGNPYDERFPNGITGWIKSIL